MKKCPLPVLLISILYLATGAIGLVSHLTQFKPQPSFDSSIVWISLVSLVAIVSGAFILRAANWARWLAMAWIVFHVVLSAFHSRSELFVHSFLCVAIACLLFNPRANLYFRAPAAQSPTRISS
jgi:hypothetical protein